MITFRHLVIVMLAAFASGCAVVGGIFKAGFWVGIIVAVAIVVGLMMLMRRK
jgi:hypothetical protein